MFVVSEHIVTKAEVAAFAGRCGGNVSLLRRRSSWSCAELMVVVVERLAVCLHFGTCSAHLHPDVFKACARLGIFVHMVPASMTAWLQPFDVAAFSSFKGWVVREVERKRLSSTSG